MAGSFYPLTMPLTVGPGSIAIMLTVGSSAPNALSNSRALLLEAGGGLAAVAGSERQPGPIGFGPRSFQLWASHGSNRG